jgi:hypothetical protein
MKKASLPPIKEATLLPIDFFQKKQVIRMDESVESDSSDSFKNEPL